MTSYPLNNILLPAVIISSAVFSALTLPFAFINSEPVTVEFPPLFSGEIQPIFNGDHKDIAIPYVGFAIVVSVGAGITSVEINRRWQAYRESAIAQKPLPDLQQNLEEAQPEALNPLEYRPEASTIDFSSRNQGISNQALNDSKAILLAQNFTAEASEPAKPATQLDFSQLTTTDQTDAISAAFEELNFSELPYENNSIRMETSQVSSQSTIKDWDLVLSNVLESRQQYQTCRIKVPHLEQRLFAILVDGQYYSFIRAEKTRENALGIMAKLSDKVQKMVITKTEKGYVFWSWEPEAS